MCVSVFVYVRVSDSLCVHAVGSEGKVLLQ